MRHGSILLTSLLVIGTATARVANADIPGNPYHQVIVDRNVFGLKSPPPPPSPESLKPPPSKLILVGIVNVFGTKKAIIKSAEAPKPAAPGQPQVADDPYMLTEGQAQQGISVLAIDEKGGSVMVDNNGQPETLTFEKNGAKLPSGPAVPAPGVAPGGAPGGIPRPGMPGVLPVRPGMPGMASGAAGFSGGAVPGMAGTEASMPSRNVRSPTEQAPLSREEQIVMFEVLREKYKNSAMPPPIPPTPLSPSPNNPQGAGSLFPQ